MVKCPRKSVYTANIKSLGVRFGGRLTGIEKSINQINNIFINKQITNTAGYEGTYYLEDDLVYISAVKYKGKKISLGRFLDVREAYEKYHIKKKEILLLYLKDFYWIDSKIKNACLNKLERQYTQTINNNIKVVI